MIDQRPHFNTLEDYLDHVGSCLERAQIPWEPVTVEELVAVTDAYPDHSHLWRPGPEARRIMGLPDDFGRPAKLWTETEQRRFIATLVGEARFRLATIAALEGAQP